MHMDFPVGEKYCVQFIAKFFWTFGTSLLGQALTIGQGQGNVKRIEINQVTFQDISVILSDPSKALSHLLSVSVQVRVMTQVISARDNGLLPYPHRLPRCVLTILR